MYQLYFPARPLQPYIQVYWINRSPPDQPSAIRESIFVDGRADIVFNFGCAYQRRYLTEAGRVESLAFSNLDSQREYPMAIEQNGIVDLMGVRFQPGGLGAFVSLPLHEISNLTITLKDAFGAVGVELENRLFDAVHDPIRRIALLDEFFLRRLVLSSPFEFARYVAGFIESSFGAMSMKQVSSEVGYSIRSVDRAFRQGFGLSPKFYARVIRFQRAIKMLSGEGDVDLAEITFACGYYDQSHFTHEFIDFTSQPPTQYRALLLERAAAPPPNHVQFLQEE
jgi:AraC-like DNA-binding protein